MGPKIIHYLNNDSRRKADSPQSEGLKHLAAAHEKLIRLQAIRRKLKEDYTERVAELDIVTRRLEDSRGMISQQSKLLNEYDSIIQAQSGLIDNLRAETIELKNQLEQPRARAARQSDAPSITVRALEKYDQGNSLPIDNCSKKPSSLSIKLHGLLKSIQILDRS